jgi:hypothetical protein
MMLCTSNAVIEREQKRHPIAKTFTLASHRICASGSGVARFHISFTNSSS